MAYPDRMVLADVLTGWELVAFAALTIALFLVLAWLVLLFYRGVRQRAEAALANLYQGLGEGEPTGETVLVVFHTYYGFLRFVEPQEHRVRLPPAQARLLLRRLHRFNLTWGLLAKGGVLIVPLSFFNYLAQKRSIRKQEEAAQS